MLVSVTPQLPGLVNAVNPSLPIGGAVYISDLNWYYGIFSCAAVYSGLSLAFPARETLVSQLIETPEEVVEGGEWPNEKEVSVKTEEM
jgi:NCS1 family nucleobase:cation symporter-1